jgi:hypothetical protein
MAEGNLLNGSDTPPQLVKDINDAVRGNLTVQWVNKAVNSAVGTLILTFSAN